LFNRRNSATPFHKTDTDLGALKERSFPGMSEPCFIVRRLGNPDADTFRLIRLESLLQNPNDFGSTFEKESNEASASFVERFDRNTVFGGFVRERLMGIVGFSPLEGPKRSNDKKTVPAFSGP
jgi:hypothetical protein